MVKIGDALKKAVETEPQTIEEAGRRGRASSVLMNPNRRRIFQFLCFRPCSNISTISADLKVSRVTVAWHVKALLEAGYLEGVKYKNRDVYCPKGMISSGKAMTMTITLGNDICRKVYKAILEKKGTDVGSLKESLQLSSVTPSIRRLEEVGLISSVRDGRHKRYFPTMMLEETIGKEGARLKAFRRSLIKRMENEHLRPEVMEIKGGGLVIIIRLFGQTEEIEIPYHPIETLLTSD